jgi:GLPGLI family protein
MIKTKHLLISILSLYISLSSFSQELLDSANLKCMYRYVYLRDTLKNEMKDDLIVLQIGKKISKCYSYYTLQCDSTNSTSEGRKKSQELMIKAFREANGVIPKNFPHKKMRTIVYSNYPQNATTVTDGFSSSDFIYNDGISLQKWCLLDSTKLVLSYVCQKAECNFRGRKWTAWFALEIPVNNGPWKFGGLPGLIMEVYDVGKQYNFSIIGIEKCKNLPIVFSKATSKSNKYEKTNRIVFLEGYKQYLMDINSYIQIETGIDLSNRKPPEVMLYDLIERDYK